MSTQEIASRNRQLKKELIRLREDRIFYGRMAGRATMAVALAAAFIIAQALGLDLIQIAIVSIVGAAAGYLVGFFFIRKILMKKREDRITKEIDQWADEFMELYEIS